MQYPTRCSLLAAAAAAAAAADRLQNSPRRMGQEAIVVHYRMILMQTGDDVACLVLPMSMMIWSYDNKLEQIQA